MTYQRSNPFDDLISAMQSAEHRAEKPRVTVTPPVKKEITIRFSPEESELCRDGVEVIFDGEKPKNAELALAMAIAQNLHEDIPVLGEKYIFTELSKTLVRILVKGIGDILDGKLLN